MCLILFAVDVDPRYPLLLAANRDEMYSRPTEGIHRWEDLPILGGRDLTAGGTWMGVSTTSPQRMAAVTNVRLGEPEVLPDKRSRGDLPVDFLVGDATPRQAAESLVEHAGEYAPVNLLVADGVDLWWATNAPEPQVKVVPPGWHGLSNGVLDSNWPKVTNGVRRFERVATEPDAVPDDYLAMLDDRRLADPARLPDTGIDPEREHQLSAMFVDMDGYGTRASSVLRMRRDRHGDLTERRFRDGDAVATTTLNW